MSFECIHFQLVNHLNLLIKTLQKLYFKLVTIKTLVHEQ